MEGHHQGQDAIKHMIIKEHMGRPIGSRALINHLTSGKGQQYNLHECIVVGRDPISPQDFMHKRLHVQVINPSTRQPSGEAMKLKRQNLIPLMPNNNPNPKALHGSMPRPPWKSRTSMSAETTLRLLKLAVAQAIAEGDATPPGRGKVSAQYERVMFLKSHLAKGAVPPVSKCMDDMIPSKKATFEILAGNEIKPPCFGVGEVDFGRFRECCSEGTAGEAEAVNCMNEWVASGFCEQCQISIFGRKSQQHFMSGGPEFYKDTEDNAVFAA